MRVQPMETLTRLRHCQSPSHKGSDSTTGVSFKEPVQSSGSNSVSSGQPAVLLSVQGRPCQYGSRVHKHHWQRRQPTNSGWLRLAAFMTKIVPPLFASTNGRREIKSLDGGIGMSWGPPPETRAISVQALGRHKPSWARDGSRPQRSRSSS